MKTKTLIASIFAVAYSFTSLFADVTDVTSGKEIKNGASETIASTDEWKFSSGSSLLVENSTLLVNGIIRTTGATTFRFDSRNSTGSKITFDGGKFINENTSANVNIIIGQDANRYPIVFEMKNGSTIGYAADVTGIKNLDMEVGRNTVTTFSIDATSSINATSMNVATRGSNSEAVVTDFNVNGGAISLSSGFYVATAGQLGFSASGLVANININSGGSISAASAQLLSQSGKPGEKANKVFMTVKDSGSKFAVTSNLQLGVASVENIESGASLEVHTGASVTVDGTTTVNNYGSISLVLDSSNFDPLATGSMFKTSNLYLHNNSGTTAAILIDGSLLAAGSFVAGQEYSFTLLEVTGNIFLNGTQKSISDADFLSVLADYISFMNNTGSADWYDFDVNNLYIDGNKIGIAVTAIPEPATVAVIFGMIALSIAAYRRKK